MAVAPTASTSRPAKHIVTVCLRTLRSRLLCRERKVDTNSTQTPTGSHQAHGRLAFRIVKERCSYSTLLPRARKHGRTLHALTQPIVPPWKLVELDGIEPTTPCLPIRSQLTGVRAVQPWWSWTGSNRRPPACKAGALPTELQPRVSMGLTDYCQPTPDS